MAAMEAWISIEPAKSTSADQTPSDLAALPVGQGGKRVSSGLGVPERKDAPQNRDLHPRDFSRQRDDSDSPSPPPSTKMCALFQ